MINRSIFFVLTTSLLILPVSINASNLKSTNPHLLESDTLLAQNYFHHSKRRGNGKRLKKLLQQLDLTPQQSEQIKAIRDRFERENETLDEAISTQHQEMRSLLANELASSQELKQKHQQLQNLHLELSNNRFQNMLEVREVLTPEQRRQLAELRKNNRFDHDN